MTVVVPQSGKVAVLGGGAWGTALAHSQCIAGNEAMIWMRDEGAASRINDSHENFHYLPGISLAASLRATASIAEAMRDAVCILAAIPAQALRGVLETAVGEIPTGVPLILCAKGIERETGQLPSDIASELLKDGEIGALSGPSFATDVARGLPTAVTVAARDKQLALDLSGLLSAPHLRCYSSNDLKGVEIGGALKNVLAIAAGIVAGAGLGASAQAALTTRGFVELRRVGAALGGQPETLMGLSGLGDLILTCGSAQSRNFAYGLALGRNEPVAGLPLAEGVATAGIAAKLAREHMIEVPIVAAVAAVLDGNLSVGDAVSGLMNRPLKAETS